MRQGLQIQGLAEELERQRKSKRDYLIDTRSMQFALANDSVVLAVDLPGDGATEMPLRKTAHRQFGLALDIPKKYYDRMADQAPDLLALNLNHWLRAAPKRKLLRTMDGDVRALLSDRYRPLDNYDLAAAVLPKLGELDAEVVSSDITEDWFYLKATTPKIIGDVQEGDTIQAGIVVANSEVGAGALKIEEMDYRLVCINGMIRSVAVRKTHLGRGNDPMDGAREFFRDETRRLEDAAFWNKVVDTTTSLFDQERFDRRLLEYKDSMGRDLSNPIKAVEAVASKLDFSEGEQDNVLSHLIRGGDLTQWGLANAVTRASQDVEDYNRATEMESAGGQIIELPPEDWAGVSA